MKEEFLSTTVFPLPSTDDDKYTSGYDTSGYQTAMMPYGHDAAQP